MNRASQTKRENSQRARDQRRSPRLDVAVYATVVGRHAEFPAVLVDVSAEGARIVLDHPEFTMGEGADDVTRVGLRASFHFASGIRIRIDDPALQLEAALVRLARASFDRSGAVVLGCRFRRRLTSAELRGLVGSSAASEPAAPAPTKETKKDPAPKPPADPAVPSVRALLEIVVERGASDLHLKAGSPIRMRHDGKLIVLDERPLDAARMEAWVRELIPADRFDEFDRTGDYDFGWSLEGRARFRINALKSKGAMGLAIRRIPEDVPSVESLGLSPLCKKAAEKARGLVLVTGPTGSGKSTTLAAMVRHINHTRACHIVTMEDPIEYLHVEKYAHITQREIGRDTADFASALRRALRQDPDVLMVGELRDLETIRLAVTAAETGHLVFGTLHTSSAALAISRIIDVFPPEQQRQIRLQLADSLQMIIAQTMLPKIGGGVVVAQEILVSTQPVRALIREGKLAQIANVMQTGSVEGMQMLEDVLNDFVARGWIGYESALAKAAVPRMIEKRGRRIDSPRSV